MNIKTNNIPYYIELLGLTIILVASMWQFIATDPWDVLLVEWENKIQNDSDQAILASIAQLANMVAANNYEDKLVGRDSLQKQIYERSHHIYNEHNKRSSTIENGQPKLFHSIRNWLFFVGTLLAICSKIIERRISFRFKG